MVIFWLNPRSACGRELVSHDLRRAVGLCERSGQFRKGATVPRGYSPGDYGYLYNSKLSMHAARPHTPLRQKRQVLPSKKVAKVALRRPEYSCLASARAQDWRRSAASRRSDSVCKSESRELCAREDRGIALKHGEYQHALPFLDRPGSVAKRGAALPESAHPQPVRPYVSFRQSM